MKRYSDSLDQCAWLTLESFVQDYEEYMASSCNKRRMLVICTGKIAACFIRLSFYSIEQMKWASMNIDCLTNLQYKNVVDYLASKYSSKNMLV